AVSIVAAPLATLTFDLRGRPIGVYQNHLYYARGFDGRTLEKKWKPEGRHIRSLSPEEAGGLYSGVVEMLKSCRERVPDLLRSQNLQIIDEGRNVAPSGRKARRILDSLISYDASSLISDEARFRDVYKPIGVLPPDQYLSLVVQLTEGCAWNRCTFCTLYAATPARVKTRREISAHVKDIKKFFGKSLRSRCSIFLGDANAFQASHDLLLWTCRTVSRHFPELASPQEDGVGGIYAFGEALRLLKWSPEELARLKDAGMRRIYVGVETGADPLRRWVRKLGTARQAAQAVENIKAAGLNAGIIILLGLGGQENSALHVEGTKAFLDGLPFDRRDLVYFSPFQEEHASEYGRRMLEKKWTPVTEEGCRKQMEEMRAVFAKRPPEDRPQTAIYDIREFLY
ncbi:MAG: radical SAM protein, partial [Elusimicrobia bacterium]|nr:radical SAM protein [Elusimicrobiota bacterium]